MRQPPLSTSRLGLALQPAEGRLWHGVGREERRKTSDEHALHTYCNSGASSHALLRQSRSFGIPISLGRRNDSLPCP